MARISSLFLFSSVRKQSHVNGRCLFLACLLPCLPSPFVTSNGDSPILGVGINRKSHFTSLPLYFHFTFHSQTLSLSPSLSAIFTAEVLLFRQDEEATAALLPSCGKLVSLELIHNISSIFFSFSSLLVLKMERRLRVVVLELSVGNPSLYFVSFHGSPSFFLHFESRLVPSNLSLHCSHMHGI